jgi:alpha-methylacyl-CoA racemase
MAEVRHHPHHLARGSFVDDGRFWQPAPAPRFSRTEAEIRGPAVPAGTNSSEILHDFGFSEQQIAHKLETGAVIQA